MTFDIALEVRCEGNYVRSTPSRYYPGHGNYLPGECAHIENFKVFLGEKEITKELTKKQLQELETDYLIAIESDEVA